MNLFDQSDRVRRNVHGSHDIFRQRWSPRAMTGEAVADADLLAMFEAAHWAPSSYNNQPWRFIYTRRDYPDWDKFIGLLGEFNRAWCVNAGALVVIVSKTTFDHDGKFSLTHAFDTGAAWGMLALEGAMRGLVVHGMQGFDYAKAKAELGVPDGYEVMAMAAVGVLADLSALPKEMAEREVPSGRKDLSRIAAIGRFMEEIR
jgi:nitroreductase